MSLSRKFRPFFHLGWLLASLNLAVSVYALAGREPQSTTQMQATYSNPPAWDLPIYIAGRSIQGPALDGPLLGALQNLNVPAIVLSTPFYILLFRVFRGGSLLSASYIYAFVLAFLTVVQWLFVGRAVMWFRRRLHAAFTRAT